MNASIEDSLSESIRGSWPLDTGSGTNAVDSSGNSNTLSMTGSPSWVAGTVGPYALDFSGSGQYLSIADPASGILDIGDGADFSISGWFNRDTFTTDHTIVAKKTNQTTNAGYVVWIDASTDTVNFEISDGSDTYEVDSTTAFTATGWHHFVVVWDDSMGAYIYLDGRLDNSNTTSTASINSLANTNAFRIGAESDAGVPFDGKIDNITLYGHALSADEAFKLSRITVPIQPIDTGLVGHWTFDGNDVDWGNTGTEIKDVSGQGNDGDAVGLTTASVTRGKLGQGLSFNGTSDYIGASYSSFNFTAANKYTWVFWAKPSGFAAYTPLWFSTFSYTCFSGSDLSIYAHSTSDSVPGPVTAGVSFVVSNSGVGGYFGIHTTDNVLAIDEWNNIAVTYDGTLSDTNKVTLYIDGVDRTDRTDIYDTVAPGDFVANDTFIGSDDCTMFAGYLDDVRMYSRVLSASEIVNLYNVSK